MKNSLIIAGILFTSICLISLRESFTQEIIETEISKFSAVLIGLETTENAVANQHAHSTINPLVNNSEEGFSLRFASDEEFFQANLERCFLSQKQNLVVKAVLPE